MTTRRAGDIWAAILSLKSDVASLLGRISALTPGSGSNVYWSQANWYVDPVNGVDINPGTLVKPVKTIMGGIVAKWGTYSPVLAQDTTITVLNPQTLGQEDVILTPYLVGGVNLGIIGTLIAFGAAFSPGGRTAKAPGDPGVLLQLTGMPAGTVAGMLVYNLTKQSYAFVDSIAAGTATMSQPIVSSVLTTVSALPTLGAATEDNTWAATDTYQRYSLPLLNLKVLSTQGGDANAAATSPCAWLQNFYIPDVSGTPGFSAFAPECVGSGLVMSNCWFDSYVIVSPNNSGASGEFLMNCRFNGSGAFSGNNQLENCNIIGGILGSTAATTSPADLLGHTVINGDAIVHQPAPVGGNSNLGVFGPANYVQCYFDANVLCEARYGGTLIIQDVYGLGAGAGHPVLWGAGTLDTEGPGSCIKLETGDTWAHSLTMATLHLDGASTGTKYVTGTFTDAVALSTANLDSFSGLQNPLTGSRYSD